MIERIRSRSTPGSVHDTPSAPRPPACDTSLAISFGLSPQLIARARAGGARVLVQVASADAARAAADAGADALIVQGVEAGGHVLMQAPVGNAATARLKFRTYTARRQRYKTFVPLGDSLDCCKGLHGRLQ